MPETTRPKGRPSTYTHELGAAVCQRLAEGESLRAICRGDSMPAESTVRAWALDDIGGFSAQYAKARDIGMEAMADELLEISDDGSNDWMEKFGKDGASIGYFVNGEAMGRSRLRVDTRKWLLSKIAPKKYGDRVTTELTGKDGKDLIPEISDTELGRRIAFILTKATA